MELQKSSGSIETQIKTLCEHLTKIEDRHEKMMDKFESKIDGLDGSVRSVRTGIKVLAQVSTVLFSLALLAGGVLWTLSQDAVKDIAKTAINSTIAKANESAGAAIAPGSPVSSGSLPVNGK
ncbi:hypothetical protein G7017_17235 [Pseudomonas fulva]|uniref:hypothetical protein n=1 Tax=Pseudomonas fulva TaxID=47880 RepID=UPI0015E41A6C|nr:hypothetical protein [Pseudomonas fulva]MBA1222617.1 hypothetical protein [Pseudomonas fulva]MBN4167341.1 hypothetical protein [Pseudomonas fulva]